MEGILPYELKYSQSHSWVKIEKDLSIIGISDYAQKSMGEIIFVELPPIGKELKKEESFGILESAKAVSDLFSPLSGRVIDVNFSLLRTPDIINSNPYETGWMIKLKMKDTLEIDSLLDAKSYKKFIEEESKT